MTGEFQVLQGQVCWYNFGDATGSMPGKVRPVVVIQGNQLNKSKLHTTIIVPLTSRLERADFPGNVFVSARSSGLPKDSVALPTQVTVINKADLEYPAGLLPSATVAAIIAGLNLTLDN